MCGDGQLAAALGDDEERIPALAAQLGSGRHVGLDLGLVAAQAGHLGPGAGVDDADVAGALDGDGERERLADLDVGAVGLGADGVDADVVGREAGRGAGG